MRRSVIRSGACGLAVAAVLGFATPAAAASPPLSDADYWALADRMMSALDSGWRPTRDAYAGSSRVNAAMLLAHSIAALRGHTGPTRQDARARLLVSRLISTPVWLGAGPLSAGSLTTCWSGEMDGVVLQHASLEPKVAEALEWAWRARTPLGLSGATVDGIVQTLTACARSAPWQSGTRVANQINWNAELFASAATVSGARDLLVDAYRRQLAGFAAAIARPAPDMLSPNLGRGYQFHYLPQRSERAPINLDSAEYANIVMHAIGYYDVARRLGARPLPRVSMRRMRAWVTRVLAGSWTHGGYLNWDTGKGLRRWHSAQYWAFAQQGLQAIATSPRFWADRRYGRWSKAIFDRALMLFRRLADESGKPLAPPRMFGVRTRMESYDCFCARTLSNIVRAVGLGMGSMPAEDPPPLYAFDYDTGRLAVTTPRYSTAIVPDNRGAFQYGGVELARLFGPDQKVAANIGGTPPGAFGIVVSDRRGRQVLASQRVRAGRRAALRLLHAPRGVRPRPYPARPYAGPFKVIEARGTVRGRGVRISATHRFRRASIDTAWRVSCSRHCASRRVRAFFPTWGTTATVDAELRDGTRVRLAGRADETAGRLRLDAAAALTLGRGQAGGYRLLALDTPPGTTLTVVEPRRQRTNPRPGPSLAFDLPAGRRLRSTSLAVRIAPTG